MAFSPSAAAVEKDNRFGKGLSEEPLCEVNRVAADHFVLMKPYAPAERNLSAIVRPFML